MRGGKPGHMPSFKELPHPVPFKIYDPFKQNAKKSDEWNAKKLLAEINNGRVAMIGLMGLLSEAKVPVSVPCVCVFNLAKLMFCRFHARAAGSNHQSLEPRQRH